MASSTCFDINAGASAEQRPGLSSRKKLAVGLSIALAMLVGAVGFLALAPAAHGTAVASKFLGATPSISFMPVSVNRAAVSRSPRKMRVAAERAGARAGCRGNRLCMMAVGVFYSTTTGNTEGAASYFQGAIGVEPKEISEIAPGDLATYDGLIVGAPTWHTGADTMRSGTAWDDVLEEIKGLDLAGKHVAVFGCGDSAGYSDNFCDAIEELHSTFQATGAKLIGLVDASGYTYDDSKSVVDGKFLGLPLDEDNEDDLSEERVKAWVAQLKAEGMPI